jgi:hypothetical protein
VAGTEENKPSATATAESNNRPWRNLPVKGHLEEARGTLQRERNTRHLEVLESQNAMAKKVNAEFCTIKNANEVIGAHNFL